MGFVLSLPGSIFCSASQLKYENPINFLYFLNYSSKPIVAVVQIDIRKENQRQWYEKPES